MSSCGSCNKIALGEGHQTSVRFTLAALHIPTSFDLLNPNSLRDIMTCTAFLNAITITNILGGSTNAVLHLLAIARSAEVSLTVNDFQTIRDRTPYLANLKPSGQYVMEDLHKAGGIPSLLKYILTHSNERVRGLIDFDVMTVTGKTWRENLKDIEPLKFGEGEQDVIRPFEKPLKETGHLTILRGNLCPGSAVAKLTGKEGLKFEVSSE